MGCGLTYSHASRMLTDSESSWQFEIYASMQLSEKLFLTPSLQQVWNADLGSTENVNRVAVFSLRLHQTF
jgi:hypothetical protein